MTITAEDVRRLREKTGAGMMACKQALQEAKGDIQGAIEFLRKQGLSVAAKRAGKTAAEGTIGSWIDKAGTAGVFVEVNSETDFVARTDDFQTFVGDVTALIATHQPKDLAALLTLPLKGTTVKEMQTELVAKIGENIGIRRFVRLSAEGKGRQLSQYLHAGNKIGVMVVFHDPLQKLPVSMAREVAMHVAAMNPHYVRQSDVPESVVAKEKEIQLAQLEGQKKPAEILEKIVVGKLQRFMSDVCLEEQIYVRDPEGKLTVAKALKTVDAGICIEQFVRYQVGEGV